MVHTRQQKSGLTDLDNISALHDASGNELGGSNVIQSPHETSSIRIGPSSDFLHDIGVVIIEHGIGTEGFEEFKVSRRRSGDDGDVREFG